MEFRQGERGGAFPFGQVIRVAIIPSPQVNKLADIGLNSPWRRYKFSIIREIVLDIVSLKTKLPRLVERMVNGSGQ